MKNAVNRIIIIFIILFFNIYCFSSLPAEVKISSTGIAQSQEKIASESETSKDNNKDIIDNDGILFKVMIITMITWIALSIYIYFLNKKVRRLEKKLLDEE